MLNNKITLAAKESIESYIEQKQILESMLDNLSNILSNIDYKATKEYEICEIEYALDVLNTGGKLIDKYYNTEPLPIPKPVLYKCQLYKTENIAYEVWIKIKKQLTTKLSNFLIFADFADSLNDYYDSVLTQSYLDVIMTIAVIDEIERELLNQSFTIYNLELKV
jgi:hypothetical protein